MKERHAWDPASYLATAATEHILSIDAEAAATSIVNYYEYIAAHLEQSETSKRIVAVTTAQQSPSSLSRSTSDGGEDAHVVRGVAMCVPFRVVVVLQSPSPDEESSSSFFGGDDRRRAAVFHALCHEIERFFREMRDVFGHQPTSLLRQLDKESDVTVDNRHLSTVLRAALSLQCTTGGTFTTQGQRLQRVVQAAIQRGDGTGGVPCDDTARVDRFMGPWSPESPLHAAYTEALEDLRSDVVLTPVLDPPMVDGDGNDLVGQPLRLTKRAGMPLDLDAIAKGYIVDQLVALLQGCCVQNVGAAATGCLVEWGGDVRVWGHPVCDVAAAIGDGTADVEGPLPKREWMVGIRLPPKLDALYSSWQAKRLDDTTISSPFASGGCEHPNNTERSESYVHFFPQGSCCPFVDGAANNYLHGVLLSGTGSSCAMATSGDYEQVQRFGYTHIVDAAAGTLTRALGHTVASVSVVAASAMLADGMATALLASQRLDAALHAIRHQLRPLGLLRFHIYVRNHNQWVHDADDAVDGDGDDQRLAAREHQLAVVLHEATGAAAGSEERRSTQRPGGSNDGGWKTAAVQRVQNADACHHLTEGGRVPSARGGGTGTQFCAPTTLQEQQGASASHALRRTLKRLCKSWIPHLDALIVFASEVSQSLSAVGQTTASSTNTTTLCNPAPPLLIVRLSSVVLLATAPRPRGGAPLQLTFNVMRGTALHNAVLAAASSSASGAGSPPLVLHFLRSGAPPPIDPSESLPVWAKEARRRVVALLCKDTDANGVATPPRHAAAATFEALVAHSEILLLTVQATEMVGDHLVVLASGVSPTAAMHPAASVATTIAPFSPSRIATTNCVASEEGPALEHNVFPVAPAVVLASHRDHGLVGFPAFGLRMCSDDPLMVSISFKRSCASELVVMGEGSGVALLANPDLTIVLPRCGCTWFDADAAAAAAAAVDEGGAARSFCYVPMPIRAVAQLHRRATTSAALASFPEVAAVLHCRLISTMVSPLDPPASVSLVDPSQTSYCTLVASVSNIFVMDDAVGADGVSKALSCVVYNTAAPLRGM